MKYHFHTLKNGLRIGIVPVKEEGIVSLLFMVNAGSKCDPKKLNGVAHFTEHMLFKGTRKWPRPAQIEKEIERVGGSFNAFTTKEFTWFSIKLLKNDIEKAFDVLSDVLGNPLLLEIEMEKEKRVILEELNIYGDSHSDVADDLFDKCMYRSHPIARPIIGNEKSIEKIRRKDIVDFFNKYYCAKNTVLAIAGDVDAENCLDLAKKYFSAIPKGRMARVVKVNRKQQKPRILMLHKPGEQVQVAIGVEAYDIQHPDHYVCKIIALILGGSTSTRLFVRLREELGLVYDVCTMAESKKVCGHLVTYTGVERRHLEDVIRVIISEYQLLKEVKISSDELRDVKSYLLNKKIISFEDSYFTAMDIAKRATFNKKDKDIDSYRKKIEKITTEDVYRVAQDIFVSNTINLALVGPVKNLQLGKIKKLMNSL